MEERIIMKIKHLFLFFVFICFYALTASAVDIQFTGNKITYSPASPQSGDLMTFVATFKVVDGPVANFKITGEIDGVQLFERIYASISEGATKTDSFTWTATTGKHYVRFKLDPDNVQGDPTYKDNWMSKSFTVPLPASATDGPNMLVKSVSMTPALSIKGAEKTFTVTFKNNGNMPAAAHEVSFRTDVPGEGWKANYIDILAGGAQKVVTWKWKIVCGATITINADEYNVVMELNENDNLRIMKINCGVVNNPF
jgi:hypothetical protein